MERRKVRLSTGDNMNPSHLNIDTRQAQDDQNKNRSDNADGRTRRPQIGFAANRSNF